MTTFISDLLSFVYDKLVDDVEKTILKIHQQALKIRRSKTNDLCVEKCNQTNSIMNFTNFKISHKLSSVLQNGLKYVPVINPNTSKLRKDLLVESLSICKLIFKQKMRYFPKTSSKVSLARSFRKLWPRLTVIQV